MTNILAAEASEAKGRYIDAQVNATIERNSYNNQNNQLNYNWR